MVPTPIKIRNSYLVTMLVLLTFVSSTATTEATTPPVTVISPDTVLSTEDLQTSYKVAFRSQNGNVRAAVLKELMERELGGKVTAGQLDAMLRKAEESIGRVGHASYMEHINNARAFPIKGKSKDAVGLATGRAQITDRAVQRAVNETLADSAAATARLETREALAAEKRLQRKLLKGGGAILLLWALPQMSRAAVQSVNEGDPTALIGAGATVALQLSPAGSIDALTSSTGHQDPLGQPQLVITVNFASYDLTTDLQDRWSLFDWQHPVRFYRCLVRGVSRACTSEGELIASPIQSNDFIRSIPQLPEPDTDQNLGESPSGYPQTSELGTTQPSNPDSETLGSEPQ